ncbi:hypothetical protein [Sodalis sp. RH20]|uniref:hypothetical protein n=1 Tax=unclassified Sodalis (in: enterobacteria) TaxID=2636512 RepID=UPI0039B4B124
MVQGICKLCMEHKVLMNSHIIPRSYYKRIKNNSGQLLIIKEESKPKLMNGDSKEYLLCFDCEQYLSKEFERYGTTIFRTSTDVIKNENHIVINTFKFKRFYLFLLSIFWRASVCSDSTYANIILPDEINDLFRFCILKNSLKLGKNNSIRMDHFLRICVFRVIDKTGNMPDSVIRSLITSFSFKKTSQPDFLTWYFIVEGFLIVYIMTIGKNIHDLRASRYKSQLKSGSSMKIDKINIAESDELKIIFNTIIASTRHNV